MIAAQSSSCWAGWLALQWVWHQEERAGPGGGVSKSNLGVHELEVCYTPNVSDQGEPTKSTDMLIKTITLFFVYACEMPEATDSHKLDS